MRVQKKLQARKATWLAFGLVLLATTSSAAPDIGSQDAPALGNDAGSPTTKQVTSALLEGGKNTITQPLSDFDQEAEAARAYRQALVTLATLTAHPPSHTHEPLAGSSSTNSKSLLSSFFPNFQGQGPFGSAVRIVIKLHQRLWVRSSLGQLGSKRRRVEEIRGKAVKVKDLLQHSAELGNTEALYKLAYISLYPPSYYFPSDPALAYTSFDRHATLTGNASSQAFLAFFHATGYHQVVPVDQAKAQLYYTFAAQSGDKGAQMALGYRYWTGIGTLEDCTRAMQWYEQASQQAMEMFLRGPPLGATLPQTSTRLSDLVGGVYGPGASVASTGSNTLKPAIKAGIARAVGETWEDVLEYYLFNADRGETDFAYRLGKIFYQGSIYNSAGGIASGSEGVGRVPRDFYRAYYYFDKIARKVWPRDPPNPLQHASVTPKEESAGPVGYAAASAAYLGRMYLRGEYVRQDPAMARMWFERGADAGDRECHNGLGVIWRDGLVQGRKDEQRAFNYFTVAAGQELAEAQVNLGKHYYELGDIRVATTYFETAVRQGSPFEAYYYLAVIQSQLAQNPVQAGTCAMAVSFHKIVAERGVWGDDLLRDAEVAWSSETDRGKEMAMLKWWIAAERGSEVAQNNLAFVLDQDKSILRLTRFSPTVPSNDTARLALTQWTRSAAQRNVDALVKVGDYYYHGLGDPEDDEAARLEKAARYYQSAADTQFSALAMWNLGWMYENGVGVPQDFHLAKRHYDMALETNAEAYLPATISLIKLHLRSIWHTLMGGKNGLDLWNFDDQTGHSRQWNGGGREIDEGKHPDGSEADGVEDKSIVEDMEDDGPWYLGKAKEEYKRKLGQDTTTVQEIEDPIQWARDRRNAEQERDSDFGPEDYFEGAMRGGNRGEEEIDQFGETMILVALCLAVAVLIYVRVRLVERMRRDQEAPRANGNGQQQEQPRAQAQAFPPVPPVGNPDRDDWGLI